MAFPICVDCRSKTATCTECPRVRRVPRPVPETGRAPASGGVGRRGSARILADEDELVEHDLDSTNAVSLSNIGFQRHVLTVTTRAHVSVSALRCCGPGRTLGPTPTTHRGTSREHGSSQSRHVPCTQYTLRRFTGQCLLPFSAQSNGKPVFPASGTFMRFQGG